MKQRKFNVLMGWTATAVVAGLFLGFSGCQLPGPVEDSARYFLLSSPEAEKPQWSTEGLGIAVQMLGFPDAAQSRKMGRVENSEWREYGTAYWAENPREAWLRELGIAVSRRLPLQSFGAVDASVVEPDYVLQLWVDEWNGRSGGFVRLAVRWRVLEDDQVISAGSGRHDLPWDGRLDTLPQVLWQSVQVFAEELVGEGFAGE